MRPILDSFHSVRILSRSPELNELDMMCTVSAEHLNVLCDDSTGLPCHFYPQFVSTFVTALIFQHTYVFIEELI